MTLCEAQALLKGQKVYCVNAANSLQDWTVNGVVRVWERAPQRVRVPLYRPKRHWWHIDEWNMSVFHLTIERAREQFPE